MNHTRRTNASNLFLLELILSILFFSIASSVCVQLFVKSHLLSQDARELNRSVIEVSSIAELIRSTQSIDSAAQHVLQLYPHAKQIKDKQIEIYYNEDFDAGTQSDFSYRLEIELAQDASMLSASIQMRSAGENHPIYQLDTIRHIARRD